MISHSRRGYFVFYEIYIDQLFIQHLLMGFLLLKLTCRQKGKNISGIKILKASLVNTMTVTLGLCTAMVLNDSSKIGLLWFAGNLIGLAGAGRVILGNRERKEYIHFGAGIFWNTVFWAGLQEGILQLFGIKTWTSGFIAAGLLWCIACFRGKKLQKSVEKTEVILYWEQRQKRITGLIDTGNLLEEPLTHQAVSIVEAESILELLGENWQQKRGFYLIPYHSIGREKGWLQAVAVDKMQVFGKDGEVLTEHPVLAIYTGKLSAQGSYQMILHPQHVN